MSRVQRHSTNCWRHIRRLQSHFEETKHETRHHIKTVVGMSSTENRAGAFDLKEGVREDGGAWNCEIFEELLVIALAFHGSQNGRRDDPAATIRLLTRRLFWIVIQSTLHTGFRTVSSGKEVFYY